MTERYRSEVMGLVIADTDPEIRNAQSIGTCTGMQAETHAYSAKLATPNFNEYRTMTDTNDPGWYKDRRNGVIRNNYMKSTYNLIVCPESYFTNRQTGERLGCAEAPDYDPRWYTSIDYHKFGPTDFVSFVTGYGFDVKLEPPGLDSEIESKSSLASAQAWSNIDHSEILALVGLAEAEKSIGTITSISQKVTKLLRLTRKKMLKIVKSKTGRARIIREVKELYLEARYGLRPMYYDIQGALAVYNNSLQTKDRYTFRGHESISGTVNSTERKLLASSTKSFCRRYLTLSYETKYDVEIRAGVLTKLDMLTNNKLCGMARLPESAWELVPFSFIVDWFFNVGDVIGTWSPNIGSSILASWLTVKSTNQYHCQSDGLDFEDYATTATARRGISTGSLSGSYNEVSIVTERTPNLTKPRMPRLDINLDPAKLLDLALIFDGMRNEKRALKGTRKRLSHLRF